MYNIYVSILMSNIDDTIIMLKDLFEIGTRASNYGVKFLEAITLSQKLT